LGKVGKNEEQESALGGRSSEMKASERTDKFVFAFSSSFLRQQAKSEARLAAPLLSSPSHGTILSTN
jgi:hypothetical protein